MFETKMEARLAMGNKYFVLFMREALSFFYMLSFFFLLIVPVMSIFYSPAEIFGDVDIRLFYIADGVFIGSSLLFALFSYGERLHFCATVCSALNENSAKAGSLRNFGTVIRFFMCRILISVKKLCNTMLFFSPFFVISAITLSGLVVNENIIKSVFITLIILSAALFVVGAVFSVTVNGRYFLCDYLFWLNPRMPVRSLIKTSADFTKGRLISIACHSAVLFPWKILRLFPPATPFASVYTKACDLCKSKRLYHNLATSDC